MLTVFVVDDHEVVRRGVSDLLDEAEDLSVVGEAATAAEAYGRILATRPQVAVLDVRLPDGNGIELCRDLRSQLPDLRCLMFTSYTDDEALSDAILAGAVGYVLKDVRGTDLVDAVRAVGAGRSLLPERAASRLTEGWRSQAAPAGPLAGLTDQERAVLTLIGEGLTNRQIGERMFLAEKTVKNYVSSVLAKLGLQRRTQVAVLATELRDRPARGRGPGGLRG
ncbi:response regulator transcription factor [Nakamurella flava]|uniref:Response regulator transcription factor n=1 Tax=Nakamurella flava TaxID=2576308 RepID=A0A4U6QIP7_9ACTN|nr:response regulator transcription factor [Nakamurella flava]TKV60294.1 response regulator transcription factor [Nakamurella flava]